MLLSVLIRHPDQDFTDVPLIMEGVEVHFH